MRTKCETNVNQMWTEFEPNSFFILFIIGANVVRVWSTKRSAFWCTFGLILFTCGSHVDHIWFTFRSHVVQIWFACGSHCGHLTNMWFAFLNVVHIRCTCCSRLVRIWYRFCSKLVHIFLTCGLHLDHLGFKFCLQFVHLLFHIWFNLFTGVLNFVHISFTNSSHVLTNCVYILFAIG